MGSVRVRDPAAVPLPCLIDVGLVSGPLSLEALEDRCLLSGGALDTTFGTNGRVTGPITQNQYLFDSAVVVYPNSGEEWDASARRWRGGATFDPAEVRGWRDAGARLIGGCCRVGPDRIAAIAAALGTPS